MPISLETFRNFAALSNLGDGKNVFVSGEDKTGLAARRDVGDRSLSSRDVKLAQAQDNIYVRSQLLSAVRDALGGEGDCVFRNLQARLFGITAAHPGADAEIAAKPLTMREVRAALGAVDIRLQQREVAQQFNARIDAAFASPKVSAANRELFRSVLAKVLTDAQTAVHDVSVETLTGPGSAFAFLKGLVDGGHSSSVAVKTAILAQSLPAKQALPFLKACALFGPAAETCGLSLRLHAAMDRIAALPAKTFTPANLFKIACPTCTWPREIDKNVAALTTSAQKRALTTAMDRNVPTEMFARAPQNPEWADRGTAVSAMLNLGMTVEDAQRVLEDPKAFTAEMLPPAALFSGDIGAGKTVDSAFGQMMKDLVRDNAKVEIKGDNGDWTASAAVSLRHHPLHEIAAEELRGKLDALFGPNATDVQKANVMLFMSQNAHMIDAAFTGPLGLGNGSASGVKYVVNAEPDGSVVVQRRGDFERNRFTFEVGMRFFPDGSQRLETPPRARVRLDVSVEEVNQQRAAQERNLNANAKLELSSFIQRNYGQDFTALCASDIANAQAAFTDVDLPEKQYTQRVINELCAYLTAPENAEEAKEFLALAPEARAAKLAALKTRLQSRVEVSLAALVNGRKAEIDAAAQIRTAAGNPGGTHEVDLAHLREKISYCTWDETTTPADVAAKIGQLRDAYVAQRTAVFAAVRNLPESEAFRTALLLDSMERAHAKRDDVLFAVELARQLPVPAKDAVLDRDGVRRALMDIGTAIASVFMTLDDKVYGGEQRGSIRSIAMQYLCIERREEMQNLVGHLTAEDVEAIDRSFDDAFLPRSNLVPGTPEYVDYMAQNNAAPLLGALRDEFNV